MKYQLSSAKRPAAPVAKKPFDFAAAQEALSESLDRAQAAYQQLVAAEGRVAEVEGVLDNCKQALESINKFGLTAQGMDMMNGAEHNLDVALGLENLAIESLTTMSAATKDALKAQYVAGLEGKVAEMWKTMVERIKAFFAKILNWLKEVFTGSARLMKMVQETKFEGEFDAEKKVTTLKFADAEALVKAMAAATENVKNMEKSATQLVGEGKSFEMPQFEKAEGTLKELGWDAGKASKLQKDYLAVGTKKDMAAAWTAIQAAYKKEVAAAGGEDPSALQKLKDAFENWKMASRITGQYNAALKQVGFALLTVAKAFKAAEPAPAAAAPAE